MKPDAPEITIIFQILANRRSASVGYTRWPPLLSSSNIESLFMLVFSRHPIPAIDDGQENPVHLPDYEQRSVQHN